MRWSTSFTINIFRWREVNARGCTLNANPEPADAWNGQKTTSRKELCSLQWKWWIAFYCSQRNNSERRTGRTSACLWYVLHEFMLCVILCLN